MTRAVHVGGFGGNGALSLEALFPSDLLPAFRNLLQSVPALAPLAREMIQIRVVLDANIVQEEIRWLVKRRNPTARSALQEAIDSGIVTPLAPMFLEAEIEEHIEEISRDARRPSEEVRERWHNVRSRLHLYTAARVCEGAAAAIDPDDVPYKVACDELGADAVYSHDAHFQTMNVPLISGSPNLALRDYARSTSVVMGISFGSGLILTISFASLRGVYLMIEKLLAGFCNLPTWAKIVVAAAMAAAVTHPKSRAKLAEAWGCVRDAVGAITPGLLDAIGTVAVQFLESHQNATQIRSELQSALPRPRRRSAVQHARSICLVSKEPLSITEIESRMRTGGYTSRSRNFPAYLRRLLRASKQFVEVTPGQWALAR